MSLFQRSVKDELTSHASVVFSTLVVVWISVLLVRLLGEAAAGRIGADVVTGIAAFSSINALPTIIAVSVFIAVLTTVTRNYRESEMVVWFSSGLSLADWFRPILRFAVPSALLIATLTLGASPWAQKQIAEYRQRYEQRSDVSKVTPGQFLESSGIDRVFYVESANDTVDRVNNVFARWIENGRLNVLVSGGGLLEDQPNGDRFMVLESGHRYEFVPGTPQFRLMSFEKYGVRMESKGPPSADDLSTKARSTMQLLRDGGQGASGELLWRVSMPLLAINLALLAIPLGAVNPRLGRSGDIVIAMLVALFYLNMVNLAKAWVNNGRVDFFVALVGLHGAVAALTAVLMYFRLRVKAPKGA
ncbi:LPS export ABC transporter permease LptF [Pigmentiphaga sp.]|uniref:LPS export ABC transporter permease LptF n=1 Tax=Pigmentiphaga sp. TaxID=1977564 RepID=UPI0012C54BB8|nr:LPS export ABC transporter permease LptF [Pigmentiphaga sp.]MPS29129.1 LPS export ABC transporter permease LptF [Alcaligenaceae bacterium SAGV5]MPS54682.1 LPS export ABC transporter permease LptF [Alcaligenaceae bacterium SAGV3]MPT59832.1 LPS export ABC transporter permease LptF [Alcaligenaceae bacterium]